MIKQFVFAFALTLSASVPASASSFAVDVLRALSADDMEGRKAGTEGGRRAGDYIISQLSALGVEAEIHAFFTSRGGEGRNLIAKIPGSKTANGSVLIVSGHYDHTGVRNGQVNNGADDNASGVGALLAITKHLKTVPPKHDTWIVFFDEEEGGINGSDWFVQQQLELMVRPLANVNLDMIGRPKEGMVYVTGGLMNTALGDVMASIPTANGLGIGLRGDGPEYDGHRDQRTSSDHKHFYQRGVPFLFVHTGLHEDYHRPTDDLEKINLEDYAAVVKWSIGLVEALDENLETIAKIPSAKTL